MADTTGRPAFDLKADLLDKPRAYSFFQAVRLLRLYVEEAKGGSQAAVFHDALRIRTLLSLSFPGTDLHDVETHVQDGRDTYRITATFLGLYGSSSPLPTHYTEDLLDEASEDRSVTRDFLDVFGQPFYRLFFEIWSKFRWSIKVAEEEDEAFVERLFCLLGIGSQELREATPFARRLLRWIGLFTQFPRSAMGLQTLLADALAIPTIRVLPNVLRQVPIDDEQQCLLGVQGCLLDDDCYLGQEIDDRMGKFRIRAEDLDADAYHALLPGGRRFSAVNGLVGAYLDQPLERDIELALSPNQARCISLGANRWALLGFDTWTFSGPVLKTAASVSFDLQ